MFNKEDISPNFCKITCPDSNFEAWIIMNPRDRMVFCQIITLPEDLQILTKFHEYFYNHFGGKSITTVNPEHYHVLTECGYSSTPQGAAKLVRMGDIDFASIMKKKEVQEHLQKTESGNYPLLQRPEDYADKYVDVFNFKRENAPSFVTEEKISNGIYSADAERVKIENEFVRHFALLDDNEKIIATVMVAVHGDTFYLADLIIHKERRNSGLAQAFLFKVSQVLQKEFPTVRRAWYIAGGDGGSLVGIHLYSKIFKSSDIGPDEQAREGMIVTFRPPGPELLYAAGSIDDDEYSRRLEELGGKEAAPSPFWQQSVTQPPISQQTCYPDSETDAPGPL